MFCPAASEVNYPIVVVPIDEDIVHFRITPYYPNIVEFLDDVCDLALLPRDAHLPIRCFVVLSTVAPSHLIGIANLGFSGVLGSLGTVLQTAFLPRSEILTDKFGRGGRGGRSRN